MKALFITEFAVAVPKWFGPLSAKLGAPIKKIGDTLFEIVSESFALRIRLGQGHIKNVLATLIPANERSRDVNNLRGEIGLGVITNYFGDELPKSHIRIAADVDAQMAVLSEYVTKYCSAFLLNKSVEWNSIKEFVEERISKAGIRERKYKFPPKVREEWKLQ
jgi:hypothetical protein